MQTQSAALHSIFVLAAWPHTVTVGSWLSFTAMMAWFDGREPAWCAIAALLHRLNCSRSAFELGKISNTTAKPETQAIE